MKLLQRYIVADLLRVFSLLVVVLTVMLVFVGVLRDGSESGYESDRTDHAIRGAKHVAVYDSGHAVTGCDSGLRSTCW